MVETGDKLRYTGPGDEAEMTVERVDEHNLKIHFESEPPIHKAALHSGNFEVV